MLMSLDDLFMAYEDANVHDPEMLKVVRKYHNVEFPKELEKVLGNYLSDYAVYYFKAGFRQAVKLMKE